MSLPGHFTTFAWTGYWTESWTIHCRTCQCSKITDVDTADDTVITLPESLGALMMALKALLEEVKPLSLMIFWFMKVYWVKEYVMLMRVWQGY